MRLAAKLLPLPVGLALACQSPSANLGSASGSDSGEAAGTTSGMAAADSDAGSQGSAAVGTTFGGSTQGMDSTTGGSTGGFIFDLGMPDIPSVVPEFSCEDLKQFDKTSVGCEFYAIEMPHGNANALQGFGIGVGNPFEQEVTVTIEDMRGPMNTLRTVTELTLAGGESQLVTVNGAGGVLADEDQTIEAVGLNPLAAFRVVSDHPITAMQMQPVGAASANVTDGSLLLPTSALGVSYLGLNYPSPNTFANGHTVMVVATEDATTLTTTEGDVMLDEFDVWRYSPGQTNTGFFVGSDRPVAAFSGSTALNVPQQLGWFDHVEEQLVPLSTWGESYVGARHPARRQLDPEPVSWLVVGAAETVEITLDPPVAGVNGVITLSGIGDKQLFQATDSFVATGTEPFMLVQFMTGCVSVYGFGGCAGDSDSGDPYMAQTVPITQWLEFVPFLTDVSYPRDFVTITREAGTQVSLACLDPVTDDHFVAIPGTNYEVGFVDLGLGGGGGEGACVDGQQFLTASAPVGVLVGGMDVAASYGYPGGLNLQNVWLPPVAPPQG